MKRNAGLPDVSARALVARWAGVEAAGGPSEVNSIGATGIAQWLGARKHGVVRGDFEGQLAHVVEELKGPEGAAYSRLRSATNEYEAATGASMCERAEGYNPRSGTDYFTGKTINTMRRMGAGPSPSSPVGVTRLPGAPNEAGAGVAPVINPSAPGGIRMAPGRTPEGPHMELSTLDPRLREIVGAGAAQFEALHPGYQVEAFSGRRHGPGQGPHASQAGALDMQIRTPNGEVISSRGTDPTGYYRKLARLSKGEMLARHPDLANRFNWGGAFETSAGSGTPDWMHFDLSGVRGRCTNNLITNLTPVPGAKYGQAPEQPKPKSAAVHGSPL